MSSDNQKLDNMSAEDIRKAVVESIVPECRTVGNGFFNCVETNLLNLTSKNEFDYSKVEMKMTKEIVPQCMSTFNLEECLNKYDKA